MAKAAGTPERFEAALLGLPPEQRELVIAEAREYFAPGAFSWWRRQGRRIRWMARLTLRRLHGLPA